MVFNKTRCCFLAAAITLAGGGASAQQPRSPLWALCAAEPLAELLTPDLPAADDNIRVEADLAEASGDSAVLRGNVEVERGNLRLVSPQVTLNRNTNRVSAENLSFASPRLALTGARGEYDLDDRSGFFEQADYFFADRNAQGSAARVAVEGDIEVLRSTLEQVSYSTCNRGAEFWRLQADRLDLDRDSGRGTARGVTLKLKDTPVLYLPYLSFPIDGRRQSGFLPPRVGYSSDGGLDLRVPYYWNIAANQDATFYPRVLARRGVMLGAEYRYLGRRHGGQVDAEYLPDDRLFNDDRGALKVEHQSNFWPGVYSTLLWQSVSDEDYIDELSNNLALLNPNYLERRFDLNYFGTGWSLLARAQDFQTLDAELFGSADNPEPYGRLPQLLFSGQLPLSGLRAGLRAELARFDTDSDRVTGERVDIWPTLSARLERPWGFIEPQLGYRYTGYNLDDNAAGGDASPDRGAPILSLDGGVFLERPLANAWLGEGTLTLEPRLFYLYVPERDQDDIPLFDTTDIDPSLAALFLTNRFTGADRLGDANQLSVAVTSRFLPRDGGERLRLSAGQAYYFSRPEVGLDGPPENDDSSDFFLQAVLGLDKAFSVGGGLRWDPDRSRTERSALDLRYRPDDGSGRLVNLSHRFARDELEQLDVAFFWPLSDRWRSVGRWNYSLRENSVIDAFAGLQYDDCCWALRFLARHHRDEPDDADADNAVFVELELKGLTGIGNRIDRLLEESIFGYESAPVR